MTRVSHRERRSLALAMAGPIKPGPKSHGGARARRCPPSLAVSELALFVQPVRLRDLPSTRAAYVWLEAVIAAEDDGLVQSPGASPFWWLTDKGRRRWERGEG